MIEDEDDIREVAATALQLVCGWEVDVAGNGAQGILMAEELCPDAILLDVMMPDMDGPTTLERLKNSAASAIPVVFLTAKVQARDIERLKSLGAKGVVPKPFDPMTLGKQIGELLGWD